MHDYPAAHSMDATWFAVDDNGHVAMFATGEDGHAPAEHRDLEVTSGNRTWDMEEFLMVHLAAADANKPLRPLAELLALEKEKGYEKWAVSRDGPWCMSVPIEETPKIQVPEWLAKVLGLPSSESDYAASSSSWETEYAPNWPAYNLVLKVHSHDALQAEIAAEQAIPLSYSHGNFAYVREVSIDTIRRLERGNACLGWFEAGADFNEGLRSIGLYIYEYENYLGDSFIASERLSTPTAPDRPLRPLSELVAKAKKKRSPPMENVCLRVSSRDVVQDELDKGLVIPLEYSDAEFAYFQELPLETAKRLDREKSCEGWFAVDVNDREELMYLGLHGMGWKYYDPPFDLVPFLRAETPDKPLHIDSLGIGPK